MSVCVYVSRRRMGNRKASYELLREVSRKEGWIGGRKVGFRMEVYDATLNRINIGPMFSINKLLPYLRIQTMWVL